MPYIAFNDSRAFLDDGDESQQGATEMAFSGPAPKEQVRHRARTHQYEDIPNVPNTHMPKLPNLFRRRLTPPAMSWLVKAARAPQARFYTDTDWFYVWESALVAGEFYKKPQSVPIARELARREADLGLTPSGRKSARIRYVDPPVEDEERPDNVIDYFNLI